MTKECSFITMQNSQRVEEKKNASIIKYFFIQMLYTTFKLIQSAVTPYHQHPTVTRQLFSPNENKCLNVTFCAHAHVFIFHI